MSLEELKERVIIQVLHSKDENILKNVLESLEPKKEMANTESEYSGKIWNSLTKEQQEEVIEAYEESLDPGNFIPHDEVMRKRKNDTKNNLAA